MPVGSAEDEGPKDDAQEVVARALQRWAGKANDQRPEAEKRGHAGREQEKPLPRATDGRRLRATGRTEQFNIKVKPDWADEIARFASERSIGKAEFLERVLAEWKALGGKAGG